jgi:hypothetical protein
MSRAAPLRAGGCCGAGSLLIENISATKLGPHAQLLELHSPSHEQTPAALAADKAAPSFPHGTLYQAQPPMEPEGISPWQ